MAKPIIQSSGSTSGAGTAGQGRNDLVPGETVTLSDTEVANSGADYTGAWALVEIPEGSAVFLADPDTATPDVVIDNPREPGSIVVTCTIGGEVAHIIIAVPTANNGWRIPAFGESDPTVTPFYEYNEGGNTDGWHPSLAEMMEEADAAAQLAVAQTFTAGQAIAQVTLTDAANIAVNASLSNNFQLELDGTNGQLDNPTNLVAGMTLNFAIRQDGGGGNTLTFGTAYLFPGGAPTISAGASAEDLISGYVRVIGGSPVILCSIAQDHT